MPKKIAPKLIATDQVIYAVLSEGNGFLKELYGEAYFVDNLPRASGCFVTKEAAVAASQRALTLTRACVEEAEERMSKASSAQQADGCEYFVKRHRERFKQAQGAIVVEISIRGVV